MLLCFANYYGFDKVAREVGGSTAEHRGQLMCTQQVLLLTINLVYGMALVIPHDDRLHFGVVIPIFLATVFANYFGVMTSARYPAFRTRLDRQPFVLKLVLVLFSFATAIAAIPGWIWFMQRYYQPS
jgi:small-conductance mechanosensitive channel